MASKGLRAISYQITRKVKADDKPSHITETLIGYIVCWAQFIIHYQSIQYFLLSDISKILALHLSIHVLFFVYP